jgi:hypothetical protein
MTAKSTPTNTKPATKPAVKPAVVAQEAAPKPTGNYSFGYNAKTNEYQIKGKLDLLDHTSTGKPVYVRIPGRLVEFKTSDGRTLRFSVYVDEITDVKPVAAESGAPAGVDAKEWAAFQQFKAFQASLGK